MSEPGSAFAGEHLFPRCTLTYAPPEVIAAYNAGEDVTVAPSHDVWSLGVMAYEVIAQQPAFEDATALFESAAGARPYPWEAAALDTAPTIWRKSRLRPAVQACLARNAVERPSVADVLVALRRLCSVSSL